MLAPCCGEDHLPGTGCDPQPAHAPVIVGTLDGAGVHVTCRAPRCRFVARTEGLPSRATLEQLHALGHA